MKKIIIALFLSFVLLLSACSVPSDPITEETEETVRQKYYDVHCASHSVLGSSFSAEETKVSIYGSFDGVEVFFWDGVPSRPEFSPYDYSIFLRTESLCEREFRYSTWETLQVYADGEFYTLTDAYKQKIVTKKQVLWVFENHKAAHPQLYAANKNENTLSEEEVQRIENTFSENPKTKLIFGSIATYLGRFEECIVLRFVSQLAVLTPPIGNETFSNGYTYWVLTEDLPMELSKAYEHGLINDQELKLIAHRDKYGWK